MDRMIIDRLSLRSRTFPLVCVALTAVVFISGCMHAQTQESREFATTIAADEAIVLLAKPHVEGTGTEDNFTDCVGNDLARGAHGFKVRNHVQFVDQLFPWFEPSTAPARPEALVALLEKPGVASRIAETGVRYVVWLDGVTRKTDSGGSIACGAGPGGAGCIGFGWWEKESDYVANIWDIKETRSVGKVTTDVTGTSALVGAIVPLPFIARVQGTACNRMASQLHDFLAGADLAKSRVASREALRK
jgi:hypothetical protein